MPAECCRLIDKFDFHYKILDGKDREAIILQILKTLDLNLEVSGKHRQEKWEAGWTQKPGGIYFIQLLFGCAHPQILLQEPDRSFPGQLHPAC